MDAVSCWCAWYGRLIVAILHDVGTATNCSASCTTCKAHHRPHQVEAHEEKSSGARSSSCMRRGGSLKSEVGSSRVLLAASNMTGPWVTGPLWNTKHEASRMSLLCE